MAKRTVVIFDTSALNKLADDRDSTLLVAGLTSGFKVRLTGTNVDEIVGNRSAARRQDLLNLCKRLVSVGSCIQTHHLITERLIGHFSSANSFDWKSIDMRFPEYEDEVARQEIVSDEVAEEQREYARSSEGEFVKLFNDARPAFENLWKVGTEKRPTNFLDLVDRLQINGGAFWSFGSSLYERVAKNDPGEATIRHFVEECPPFRVLLLAICMAQYERCIRDLGTGPSLRAGRNDLFMAVYLPYCDRFITADDRQQRCLTQVASAGKVSVDVRSYEDFCKCLSVCDDSGVVRPSPIMSATVKKPERAMDKTR